MFGIAAHNIRQIEETLRTPVLNGSSSLIDLTSWSDKFLSLQPGLSMTVVQYLLATQEWRTDLRKKWDPFKPVVMEIA